MLLSVTGQLFVKLNILSLLNLFIEVQIIQLVLHFDNS